MTSGKSVLFAVAALCACIFAPVAHAEDFLSALFGALAYATYDLTNHATLRNWTLQLTLADMAWGTIASGLAGAASYYVTRTIGGWLNIA